jgi:predicted HAD superfamily phosphohydrolase YqeG
VRLVLDEEQTANLMADRLYFAVAIHVDFIEAAGKPRSQTFRSFLRCGTHTVKSSPFVGNELIAKEHPQNQKPN